MILLESASADAVELAVALAKHSGALLSEEDSRSTNLLFERFRAVLHEAKIAKRVQYMIEVLFQIRKEGFKDFPKIPAGLDLVEDEDQIDHMFDIVADKPVLDESASQSSLVFSLCR